MQNENKPFDANKAAEVLLTWKGEVLAGVPKGKGEGAARKAAGLGPKTKRKPGDKTTNAARKAAGLE